MIASKTAAVTADADTALRHKVLRRIKNRPTTRGAVVLLGILLLLALLAPFIAPQDPHDLASLSVMDNRLEPGAQGMTGITYWLGTDAQGRDMLSAILYGLRTSLLVGLTSTAGALAIGVIGRARRGPVRRSRRCGDHARRRLHARLPVDPDRPRAASPPSGEASTR